MEDIACFHHHDVAVVHQGRGAHRHNDSHVLYVTARFPKPLADVTRPLPTWLVSCSANRDSPNGHQFEFSLVETSHLVGPVESFENYFKQGRLQEFNGS